MKRTTIKSLTLQANEIESADYMDILIRDVFTAIIANFMRDCQA
jgi:hypothetical protein